MVGLLRSQVRANIRRRGIDIVWVKREGAKCPCTDQVLAGHRHDPLWHEANPSEPNCNGLGIIDLQSFEIELRAIWIPPDASADWDIEIAGIYEQNDKVIVTYPEIVSGGVTYYFTDYDRITDELHIESEVYTVLWKRGYLARGSEVLYVYGLCRQHVGLFETISGPVS